MLLSLIDTKWQTLKKFWLKRFWMIFSTRILMRWKAQLTNWHTPCCILAAGGLYLNYWNPHKNYEQSSKHWPTRNNLWRGAGSIPLLRWRETDRNRKQSFLGVSTMNFKDKKWGPYKKWADPVHVYFTNVEKSLFILRPKPFTPILFKWEIFYLSLQFLCSVQIHST